MHDSDDDYDYDNNPFASPFITKDLNTTPNISESSLLFGDESVESGDVNQDLNDDLQDKTADESFHEDRTQPDLNSTNENTGSATPTAASPDKTPKNEEPATTAKEEESNLEELHAHFLKKYQLLVKITKISRTLPDNKTIITSDGSGSSTINLNKINNSDSLNTNRSSDLVIYMELSTNLPTFRKKSNKNIVKSYKEFENFSVYLQDFRSEYFHPFYPPAIPLNKTSYGLNNEEDLVQCKINFQKWFDLRIAENVKILKLEELAIFLESDYNTYLPMNGCMNTNNNTTTSINSSNRSLDQLNSNDTMIQPTKQIKRKTLKQFQPPFDSVTYLATFRPMVKMWRKNLQTLQVGLFKMCKQRQSLSFNENLVGKTYLKMGENMISQGLNAGDEKTFSNMYKKLGKTMTTIGDMNSIMSTLNMATLYDGWEWCCRDLYNVKEQLTNRHLLMRDLNSISSNLLKNQEHIRKLRNKRDVNPLKIDESLKFLQKQYEKESVLKNKLEKVSNNLVLENEKVIIKTWKEQNINFMKNYALKNIEYERKKLAIMERIRNDVRKTDKFGGLSRLGRSVVSVDENSNGCTTSHAGQTNTKTDTNPTSVHSNNGKSVDSWSGDNRKVHKYYSEIEQEMRKNAGVEDSSTNHENATTANTITENEELLMHTDASGNKKNNLQSTSTETDVSNVFTDLNTKKYAANLLGHSTF